MLVCPRLGNSGFQIDWHAVEINGVWQDVHEGTGAMLAYQEMMYGADKNDLGVKEQWGSLLKQYCKLDTLSMVLIFEHWRRLTQ